MSAKLPMIHQLLDKGALLVAWNAQEPLPPNRPHENPPNARRKETGPCGGAMLCRIRADGSPCPVKPHESRQVWAGDRALRHPESGAVFRLAPRRDADRGFAPVPEGG